MSIPQIYIMNQEPNYSSICFCAGRDKITWIRVGPAGNDQFYTEFSSVHDEILEIKVFENRDKAAEQAVTFVNRLTT